MKLLKSVLLAPFLLSSLSFISLPTEHPTALLFPSLLEASYPAFFFPAPASFISLQAASLSLYLFT